MNATPSVSIQALLDAAAPGATVSVPPGIYRETVTITKPITLVAQPGAEIRGSDDWSTGWTRSGAYWLRGTLPAFATGSWPCDPASNGRCRWPQQVFFDGTPLYQVAANPTSGQFAVSSARQVVLADNPSGHLVEVTTRQYWVIGQSDNVTIQGFTMEHAATPAQQGAISNGGHANWTIAGNTLSDAHGAVVSLDMASGIQLLNNVISNAGQEGIHSYQLSNSLIQGNVISGSNTEQFDNSWEAGGMKIFQAKAVTISGNEVSQSHGPGIWIDGDAANITIANNRVHHNDSYGIEYEISSYGLITGNQLWENAWVRMQLTWDSCSAAICLSNADHTEVSQNIAAWNVQGIVVLSQSRSDSTTPVVGNYVHNNTLVETDDLYPSNRMALRWENRAGVLYDATSNNHGQNDAYWYPTVSTSSQRYKWSQGYGNLSDFNTTQGEHFGLFLSTSAMNAVLANAQMPLSPESH